MAQEKLNTNELAHKFINQGQPMGWFEKVYANANGDGEAVPWANLGPSPDVIEWFDRHKIDGTDQKALVIGCGLGDDAEALAQRGFDVTAFDISPTAIEWCKRRFPTSSVNYQVADLFDTPSHWQGSFDFVLEYFTIQALPPEMNQRTIQAIARHVALGGTLLVVSLGRPAEVRVSGPPWPLSKATLDAFTTFGLAEIAVESFGQQSDSELFRFRIQYEAR